MTRIYRDNRARRVYQLQPEMELPARDVVLKVTENKVQLIHLIIEKFKSSAVEINCRSKIVITGKDPIPFEISNDVIKNRPDLMTTQEEANAILIRQVSVMSRGKAVVICDDTDVFALLLHFVSTGDIKAHVLMQST